MTHGRSPDLDGGSVRTTLAQSTVTANAQTTGVDCTDLTGRGVLIVVIGTPANADNTIEVQVQESSDNGVGDAWADITGATTGTRTSDTAEVVEIEVDFDSIEAFLRLDYTVAGTTPSYEIGTIALSGGHVLPTG